MAERKRIALIYAYNESWIGGTYYIENLIAALGQLPDDEQPELLIFSWAADDADRLKKVVTYPYWSFRRFERPLSLPVRVLNKLTAILFNKRFINPLYNDIDLVFPLTTVWRQFFIHAPHHIYWIPDFQEYYLPEFFKPEEVQEREADQLLILKIAKHVVFSSYAAQNDFNSIYPSTKLSQHILQFAVTGRPATENTDACLNRYSITKPYFICSNQFWKHKNHPVVLKALALLLKTRPQVSVVFTGKEHDYRNPSYFDDLMILRAELGLDEATKFLGFIPREDQLALVRAAKAVIQPSLFEGWSTVVEDAKSLGVPILASELAVHKEQLDNYDTKLFFPPTDAVKLAECMAYALDKFSPIQPTAYRHEVQRFAQNFMSIVKHVAADSLAF
jgi:glycosyltransferase involved in cell wall biosynthesis